MGENISKKIEGGIFTNEGLIGDRHSGVMSISRSREPEFPLGSVIRNRRQISLVSQEELVQIAENLGVEKIKPDWLAANLLISGIQHFTQLPVGARFFFEGGLVLFNDGENNPCHIPAKTVQDNYEHIEGIQKEFIKAAMHKRGLLAWVEHPGTLIAGATCTVELPPLWNNFWQETD
jgi:MOSC domain-containing protein YiiM